MYGEKHGIALICVPSPSKLSLHNTPGLHLARHACERLRDENGRDSNQTAAGSLLWWAVL